MNKPRYLLIAMLLGCTVCQADIAMINSGKSYWQCTASDGDEKQWVATGDYERSATNKAYEGCKKSSKLPLSCKVAKENCEAIINGVSTRPMWQCTALDQMAKAWPSSFYTHRDDAALAAKAYCQQRSSMPDSCYINLLTCKNLNEKP